MGDLTGKKREEQIGRYTSGPTFAGTQSMYLTRCGFASSLAAQHKKRFDDHKFVTASLGTCRHNQRCTLCWGHSVDKD